MCINASDLLDIAGREFVSHNKRAGSLTSVGNMHNAMVKIAKRPAPDANVFTKLSEVPVSSSNM